MRECSPLHKERLNYKPKLAGVLADGIKNLKITYGKNTTAVKDADEIQKLFKDVYGQPLVSFDKEGEPLSFEQKRRCYIVRRASPRRTQRYSRFVRCA